MQQLSTPIARSRNCVRAILEFLKTIPIC
ncbi:MAG: hypothetical protein ACH254_02635 [Candidatus Thiodiazotropha endolucinida]